MTVDRISRLTDLVTQVGGHPELLYVAITAMADEMKAQGLDPAVVAKTRKTARNVAQMIGTSADTAWKHLPWWEKFRHRKRVEAWKKEHTAALLSEGRLRVTEILAGQ